MPPIDAANADRTSGKRLAEAPSWLADKTNERATARLSPGSVLSAERSPPKSPRTVRLEARADVSTSRGPR